jgi:hypothetical protein
LIEEKVRIPAKKKGQASFVPQFPAPELVQQYEDDQTGGPDKDKILIAWDQPLTSSSKWNTDAIILLAEKAQDSLGASKEAKYNSSWLLLPELVKQIISCLKDTKSTMHLAVGPSRAPKALADATHACRRARKQLVCYFISVVWYTAHLQHRKLAADTK